jgi:hypothetical protein
LICALVVVSADVSRSQRPPHALLVKHPSGGKPSVLRSARCAPPCAPCVLCPAAAVRCCCCSGCLLLLLRCCSGSYPLWLLQECSAAGAAAAAAAAAAVAFRAPLLRSASATAAVVAVRAAAQWFPLPLPWALLSAAADAVAVCAASVGKIICCCHRRSCLCSRCRSSQRGCCCGSRFLVLQMPATAAGAIHGYCRSAAPPTQSHIALPVCCNLLLLNRSASR